MSTENGARECTAGRHQKVHAPIAFTTFPPSTPWICARCGTEGTDRGPEPQQHEYGRLIDLKRRGLLKP